MAYFKSVMMDIQEALESELAKGFDTPDEFRSVMRDIADEYNITLSEVYEIYSELDVEVLQFNYVTYS